MRQWFKIISGLLISLVVIGTVTLLAVKYFDVLVRGFDTLRDQVARKRERLFGVSCCGYDEDDEGTGETDGE